MGIKSAIKKLFSRGARHGHGTAEQGAQVDPLAQQELADPLAQGWQGARGGGDRGAPRLGTTRQAWQGGLAGGPRGVHTIGADRQAPGWTGGAPQTGGRGAFTLGATRAPTGWTAGQKPDGTPSLGPGIGRRPQPAPQETVTPDTATLDNATQETVTPPPEHVEPPPTGAYTASTGAYNAYQAYTPQAVTDAPTPEAPKPNTGAYNAYNAYNAYKPSSTEGTPYSRTELVDDDSDDDDVTVEEAPKPLEAPQQRKDWHASIERRKHLLVQPLISSYVGEENCASKADTNGALPRVLERNAVRGTHYANNAREYGTQIKDGRIHQHGSVLNSTDRTTTTNDGGKTTATTRDGAKKYWSKDRDERLNYALDGAGGLYTADAREEVFGSIDEQNQTILRNNHSSLVGGADVAAAGSMRVTDGKVDELDDGSGHYKPSITHTKQAVDTLVGHGVMEPETSTVRLVDKGERMKGEQVVSGMEMFGYDEDFDEAKANYERTGNQEHLSVPEERMRAAHGRKNGMLAELSQKVGLAQAHDEHGAQTSARDRTGLQRVDKDHKPTPKGVLRPTRAPKDRFVEAVDERAQQKANEAELNRLEAERYAREKAEKEEMYARWEEEDRQAEAQSRKPSVYHRTDGTTTTTTESGATYTRRDGTSEGNVSTTPSGSTYSSSQQEEPEYSTDDASVYEPSTDESFDEPETTGMKGTYSPAREFIW